MIIELDLTELEKRRHLGWMGNIMVSCRSSCKGGELTIKHLGFTHEQVAFNP